MTRTPPVPPEQRSDKGPRSDPKTEIDENAPVARSSHPRRKSKVSGAAVSATSIRRTMIGTGVETSDNNSMMDGAERAPHGSRG